MGWDRIMHPGGVTIPGYLYGWRKETGDKFTVISLPSRKIPLTQHRSQEEMAALAPDPETGECIRGVYREICYM